MLVTIWDTLWSQTSTDDWTRCIHKNGRLIGHAWWQFGRLFRSNQDAKKTVIAISLTPWNRYLSVLVTSKKNSRNATMWYASIIRPGYNCDVMDKCCKCVNWSASKGPRIRIHGEIEQYKDGSPFERLAIDVAGPFPSYFNNNWMNVQGRGSTLV